MALEPDNFEECADTCTGKIGCIKCVMARAQAEIEEEGQVSSSDYAKDLKWHIRRLIVALWDARIAANGIKTTVADGAQPRIQLWNGIEEVANALWCEVTQLAKRERGGYMCVTVK